MRKRIFLCAVRRFNTQEAASSPSSVSHQSEFSPSNLFVYLTQRQKKQLIINTKSPRMIKCFILCLVSQLTEICMKNSSKVGVFSEAEINKEHTGMLPDYRSIKAVYGQQLSS